MVYGVFDAFSGVYDSWYERFPFLYRSELDCVRSLGLGGRVLDLGCGSGRFSPALDGLVVGLDPSYPMLLRCRGRCGGCAVVQGVGEILPFRDGVFDAVLMVVTLCFLDDPVGVLREAARVLRSGGLLVNCIVPRDSWLARIYMYRAWSGRSRFYAVARFYTVEEAVYMAWLAGLRYRYTCSVLVPGNTYYYEAPVGDRRGAFTCIVFEKP